MAPVSVDNLLPLVVPYLRAVPQPIVKQNLNRAAREMLQRVPLWQEEITIDAVKDQLEYSVDLSSAGSDLIAHDLLSLKDSDDNTLSPSLYHIDNWQLILDESLTPEEDEADAWTAVVHVVGDNNCTSFPDKLFARFSDAIAGRAIERLALMKGRPWYSPELAMQGRSDYRKGVQQSMIAMDETNTVSG